MADIATLAIKVENGDVIKSTASLNEMTVAGGKSEAAAQRLTRRMALLEIEARNVDKSMGLAAKTLASFSAAQAAVAALAGAEILHKFIEETSLAQAAVAQLEAAVQSTGGAAGRNVEQLDAYSMALQQTTIYSDEAVKGAQSLLLTFDKIQGVNFDRATQDIADLATRMGGDLQGAAVQVGKALQDPEHGLTALRRTGVSFSEGQVAVIKHLFDTGQAAKGQQIILQELEHQFGGSAAAARDTLGGALSYLKNQFGDLFEISTKSTGGITGAINAMGEALPSVRKKFDEFFGGIELLAVDAAVAVQKFFIVPGDKTGLSEALDAWKKEQQAAITGTERHTEAVVKHVKAVHELTDAERKAADEAKKHTAEAEKRVLAMHLENAETRALANATYLGQDAVDAITVSYAGLKAAREAGVGTAKAVVEQLRHEGEETARLTIEHRKFEEAKRKVIAAYEAEKAAAKARSDETVSTEEAVRQTIADGADALRTIQEKQRADDQQNANEMHAIWMRGIERITTDGLKSWSKFFEEVYRLSTDLMKQLAKQGDQNGGLYKALGVGAAGIGGALAGYGIGQHSGSAVAGALGGAAAGAAAGAGAGPVGIAVGALGGFIGGIFGAGAAAKEAAKQMAALQKSLDESIASIKADLAGDALGAAIAQVHAQFDALRKQNEDARAGGSAGSANVLARTQVERQLNDLEAQKIAQLQQEAALKKAQQAEDLRVEILRNNGDADAADAMALQLTRERQLAELRKEGVDEALLAELAASQAVADARAKADAAAIEAANQIKAAAEAAAAAAEKAAQQQQALEDLNVELLRAKGQGGAADDLAFQLEQQRRLEDAQKNQSADYVAKLQELQQLQRDQRAAQGLIDSTGDGGGGGGAASRGASQALASVAGAVTDRSALMLVDINRSQLTTLGEIRDIIKRTGGVGGGGVVINNRFEFTAKLTDEEYREIVVRIEGDIDESFANKRIGATRYAGSVGR
jgi:hypothetical protein